MESIRFAENSNLDLTEDLISLYNRAAIIYRQFKAFDLANEYYEKGIALANQTNNSRMIVLLNFNHAGVFIDNSLYDKALEKLNSNLPYAKEINYKLDDYYNRIASAYLKAKDYNKALQYYSKLQDLVPVTDFEMLGYLNHNIALAYEGLSDNYKTKSHYLKSIDFKKKHHDKTILFSSYFDLGRFLFESGEIDQSLTYFNKAIESVGEKQSLTPSEIEVYKLKANALFHQEKYIEAKGFEDAYTDKLNEYLDLQELVQDSDKSYNMDLITKRYFDEVAKQERIASILFYSKLISGTLLELLLFTVGFNWYQKVQLRRGIVKELVKLKIVD